MMQGKIEALLRDKIGLAASVIGSNEIARAVEQRRLIGNFYDLQTYLQQLQTSTQELEELIELVIVPETWFFRDGEPFTFLEGYVKSEWLLNQSHRILRVLSIPCSSGEEPYSIAMTLLNAGLTPNQFRIDAIDISKKSLLRATRAVYSRNSFRGNNLGFRERYFTQADDKYQLCDLVRNAVNFMHGNLLNPYLLIDKQPYDVIFCRNVLIYFEQAAREQSIQNLATLLNHRGIIFVGHAETGQMWQSQFDSVRHPMAFAYRKKNSKEENSRIRNQRLAHPQQVNSKNQLSKHSQALKLQNTLQEEQSFTKHLREKNKFDKTQNSTPNLETIRSLADRGQLGEAATLCETYLKQNCTSVEAYVLLAQVYQAQGLEEQAEQCFQKAIYLEPNHYDALMHLALLREHRGDIVKAAALRNRIQRLQR